MALSESSRRFGQLHKQWKDAEKAKNKAKEDFFRAIDQELEDELVAQSVETISAKDREEARTIAERRYPRQRVVDIAGGGGSYNVVLEDDRSLRPYQYVNPEDGMVYSRVLAENAPTLDDEALQHEDPELWERVTQERTERVMRPLDEIEPDDLSQLTPYIHVPRPTVRMGKPRAATEDEL